MPRRTGMTWRGCALATCCLLALLLAPAAPSAAEAKPAAATEQQQQQQQQQQQSREFKLTDFDSVDAALSAYAAWHTRTVQDAAACQAAGIVVWQANAGWGDSVNALVTAFRYSLASGRLFFIRWSSANEPQLWRIGLEEPDFAWDFAAASEAHPHCKLSLQALRAREASELVPGRPTARHLLIAGSLVASHPLANVLQPLYSSHPQIAYQLSDARLQRFLLRPNADLSSRISSVLSRLRSGSPALIVALQIRTGYADAAEAAQRPSNANFLAPGDEELFLQRLDTLLQTEPRLRRTPARLAVFLATDSPAVRRKMERELASSERFPAPAHGSSSHDGEELSVEDARAAPEQDGAVEAALSAAGGGGLRVVSVSEGEVAHCGPGRSPSRLAVLRMLTEWFVLQHVDVLFVTAWSLFGASAAEGMHHQNAVHRIDASNCGQQGAKPCQMQY